MPPSSDVLIASTDLSSSAFKKARRQYIRTTKNRNQDVDANWTPFRAAEKKYKARFPPPDLTDEAEDEQLVSQHYLMGERFTRYQPCQVQRARRLVLLPSFVSPDVQRTLVQWALRDHARHPNEPTSTHITCSHRRESGMHTWHPFPAPRMYRCWYKQLIFPPRDSKTTSGTIDDPHSEAAMGQYRWSYHWGTKQYDFLQGKGHIDSRLRDLCRSAVSSLEGWGEDDWRTWNETYEPDAGIVNFYQTKDTLMAHVDRSEVCATSPLVSISLGNAAIFLIGGLTREVEPTPILLRSGDVVIMSGPACRRAYHGVPRVLENTLPEHLAQSSWPADDEADASVSQTETWEPYKTYIRNARININVRQVFPKGFVPGCHRHPPRQ
ncbi:hypothetical protein EDC04DRAFT_2867794 [Pisolithus marmoratus]|nr:hypothetical protein EDC04DRAFT_2867794 [Pisolithus marmoratus]